MDLSCEKPGSWIVVGSFLSMEFLNIPDPENINFRGRECMKWISVEDKLPENGHFVLIAYEFGIGIARFVDGDWDTVGKNRKHYIFTDKEKVHSSANPQHWMPLPKFPKE